MNILRNIIDRLSFHATTELLELDNTHMWDYIDYHPSVSDENVYHANDHLWLPLCRRISDPNDFIQYAIREHLKWSTQINHSPNSSMTAEINCWTLNACMHKTWSSSKSWTSSHSEIEWPSQSWSKWTSNDQQTRPTQNSMTLIESSNEFKQFESKHLRNIVKER